MNKVVTIYEHRGLWSNSPIRISIHLLGFFSFTSNSLQQKICYKNQSSVWSTQHPIYVWLLLWYAL